jgi:hypothetical protein
LIEMLVGNVEGPSRFLFTSRVDFDPPGSGVAGGAVGHCLLSELGARDAFYLMETLPALQDLPVAVVEETRPDAPPVIRAVSMRDVYERVGGHPTTLALLAEHARRRSVGEVLADLSGVREELVRFTLLERAVAELPERTRELLARAAIYDAATPEEGLSFLLGDAVDGTVDAAQAGEVDVMPDVAGEIGALQSWGLLTRPPGQETLAVPTPVREWARQRMEAEERGALLRRAARFWEGLGQDSGDLGCWLNARHYLFLAGEYIRRMSTSGG